MSSEDICLYLFLFPKDIFTKLCSTVSYTLSHSKIRAKDHVMTLCPDTWEHMCICKVT